MAKIRRANTILYVPDDEVHHYLKLGYSIVGAGNNVIKEGITNDIGALKAKLVDAQSKCTLLEAEVARLTTELQKYKELAEQATKAQKKPAAKKAAEAK